MRIESNKTQVLIVDIQEKLFPHMDKQKQLFSKIIKLIQGLKLFKIPFILNEQYPKGIGNTIAPIKELLIKEKTYEKTSFSCCKNLTTMEKIRDNNKKFVIVFGIEAHVCVMQSVLDLLENNFIPILVTDCISSRNPYDKKIAIKRMENAGAILATYESILFELCSDAKNDVFKDISKIVK